MVRVWLAPRTAHRLAAHPPPPPARALQPRPASTGSRGTAPLPIATPQPSPRPSGRRARPPRDTPAPQSDRPRPSRRRVDSRPRTTRARARSAPTPSPFPPFSLGQRTQRHEQERGTRSGSFALGADDDVAERHSLEAVLRCGPRRHRLDEAFLLARTNRNDDFVRRKGREGVANGEIEVRLSGNSIDRVA